MQKWAFDGCHMMRRTYMLFARPSFIEGVSRIFDLGGTLSEYNSSPSGKEADFNALQSDWYAVGDDIRTAIDAIV